MPEQIIRKIAEGQKLLAGGMTVEELFPEFSIAESTWARSAASSGPPPTRTPTTSAGEPVLAASPLRLGAGSGPDVSLRDLPQYLCVQPRVREQALEAIDFDLELLEAFRVVGLHAAVLVQPICSESVPSLAG